MFRHFWQRMQAVFSISKPLRFVTALLAIGGGAGCAAQGQARTVCVLQFQDHYRCDREAFQQRLAASHTAHVSVARMELFAAKEMAKLVEDLGKKEVGPAVRPDLVFELSAIDHSGRIDFGPADFALATLSVYEPVRGNDKRRLIWVETFDGQEDRPWPGTVVDLIRQFKQHALAH